MKTPYIVPLNINNSPYNISSSYYPPKFNISTEPHYKIRKYIEEENTNIPNKKILKKIISSAINKQKYQGSMNLNNPGNKDVLTDSDSEEYYNINELNMKRINKKMLKQNGCAKLIIKKIESQTPQRNEEYYKFNNNTNNKYKKKEPFYVSKTLSNWNFNNKYDNNRNNTFYQNKNYRENDGGVYMKTNPNINKNEYNSEIKNNSDNKKNNNNYNNFNSNIDLNKIKFNKRKDVKPVANNNPSLYESSDDAEYGSSSYIYVPSKPKKKLDINTNNNNKIQNNTTNVKENDFSSQSLSVNDEYYNAKNKKMEKKKPPIILKNRPSLNELIKLNYTNNESSVLQKKFNDKLVKDVIKIQAAWKGYLARDCIKKNLNLLKFVFILVDNIENKILNYFEEFLYKIQNMKKIEKYEYEIDKTDKNEKENYDDLLKDYNILLNKYDKLEKEMNEIKALNKKQNIFDNLNITKNKNNVEILNNGTKSEDINNNKIKTFDIIKPENINEFSILIKSNNLRYRQRKYRRNIEKNNIKIINLEHFTIKENKEKLNKKIFLIGENQNIEIKGVNNTKLSSEILKKDIIINNIKKINIDNFTLEENKNKTNKYPLFIEENQNIEIKGINNNKLRAKVLKNDLNKNDIKAINLEHFMIDENIENLNENKENQNIEINIRNLEDKINRAFKDNELIIVKKGEFTIKNQVIKENTSKDIAKEQIPIYTIDKNILFIKKSKKNIPIKKIDEKTNKINYNELIDIVKTESLEINPLEMKKDLVNKTYKSFTEKAKKNILKMILPTKLKAILKNYARKELIKDLKGYKKN